MAIIGTVAPGSTVAGVLLIVFVCIYIFFFASTWGPAAWTVIGEIYPLPIRSKGVALSTASNWLWNFIIAFVTPYFVDAGKANLRAKVFFIWGSTCAACIVFAYFLVPETKGLSLEEVDKMMEETSPRKSASWRANTRGRPFTVKMYDMESNPHGGVKHEETQSVQSNNSNPPQ